MIPHWQVQFINQKIDEARPGSRLYGLRHIRDPSDDVQMVHIAWMQFFMFSRRQRLNEDDVAELHARAVHLLETVKRLLPERTGTMDRSGEMMGWNFAKAHSVLHIASYRLMHGYSEFTSTQGAEHAHKVCIQLKIPVFECFRIFFVLFRKSKRFFVYCLLMFRIVSYVFV